MTQVNMYEAKTHFSEIAKMLEEGKKDYVIVARKGKPVLRITLEIPDVSKRIGAGKNMFEIPDDFDDIDISNLFDGEIFPCE